LKAEPLKDISEYARHAQPALGFFSSAEWLGVYGDKLTAVGIYNDGGNLKGGFFHYKSTKAGLHILKLPPYSPHCGLFLRPDGTNPSTLLGFQKECIEAVASYLLKYRAALKMLSFPVGTEYMHPFLWNKFKVAPAFTYRFDLTRSIEQIRGGYDPKNRNTIAKAAKEHTVVRVNEEPADTLIEFFKSTLGASGANVYPVELTNILRTFVSSPQGITFSVRKGDTLLGAVFCVRDAAYCYYLLGGSRRGEGAGGVNALLVDRAIGFAREAGCTIFDFEGSMIPGVEKFFRGFGPQLTPYYSVYRAWLPLEIALKFVRREVF
jgi:hypothetical protein